LKEANRVNAMIGFKQFIAENNVEAVIDVDLKNAPIGDIEKINADLDAVTLNPFVNSALFTNAVRGTLERYGILLPAESNIQQLSLEGEFVYQLGDSGQYVYAVHNLSPEGEVEGYAQIVDGDELADLQSLDTDENDVDPPAPDAGPTEWMKYPKARRDDDSGETAEYA
jgi:hypothetical protein